MDSKERILEKELAIRNISTSMTFTKKAVLSAMQIYADQKQSCTEEECKAEANKRYPNVMDDNYRIFLQGTLWASGNEKKG